MSGLQPTKSAFSKPENWVTWGFTAALLFGAGYVLYVGLPYLNQIIEMGWKAVAMGVPLAIVLFVLTSHDVHKLAWFGWKAAMRALTGFIIELDPIAIMRGYAEHFGNLIEEIKAAMAGLRGQIKNLQDNIKTNNAQIQRSLTLASQAKALMNENPSMKNTVALEGSKAIQLEDSNKILQNMLDMLVKHMNTCQTMLEASLFNQKKLETTIDIKSRERDSIEAMYKAMSRFNRLIQGDKELEVFNMAIEAENNFVFQTLGEIEQFTDDSKNFLQTTALDKMANEADAFAKIDAWEKKSQELKGVRVSADVVPTPPNQISSGSFDDLFDADESQVSHLKL